MRAQALALALVFAASLFAPAVPADDFGSVTNVDRLLRIQETPSLAPGDTGRITFTFTSPYTVPIQGVRLNATIYRYATIDESMPVDANWPYVYPRIAESTGNPREWVWNAPTIAPGSSTWLNVTIVTSPDTRDMPHGSVFSQSSYFLRFWLEFTADVGGNQTLFRMVSFGFFTQAQWQSAVVPRSSPCNLPYCRGYVNVTMLAGFLGVSRVDGILADTAFGVKEPIPRWPFYALIAAAALFVVLAFLFWVEENPGSYPRVEAWWIRTRGRIARSLTWIRPVRRPKA